MTGRLKSVALALLAPAIAIVLSILVTTLVIAAVGSSPGEFWSTMFEVPKPRLRVDIVNQTAMIYIAAVAAAIGFRMGLFNIGLEGQYTIASFAAASFAGAAYLGGFANVIASLAVAMLVGAAWSGIAGLLKTTRGVSEVISTIMLNAIAVTLVGYFLNNYGVKEGNTVHTKNLEPSSTLGGFSPFEDRDGEIWALSIVALLLGIGFWVLLNKTRFGFDLRASGQSESAALASGINPKRMILISMMLSGAVAGLIWMPALFGGARNYGTSFQVGLGFLGIAVALLGRNRPVGMLFGALLFAFLSVKSNDLTFGTDVSPSIVQITQGVAVLAVVVTYEVVRRWRTRLEQRAVSRELTGTTAGATS
ncbi:MULTISPECIES: ABC transporter permease [Aeromicrobium]|uniref:ABC transporter permease n=1 Tax=Aeromicrobium TaxID=2040 RepID=UPI0006FE93ED|nr:MULTISPECIES: ABC transporter permease [Aeromicrobium]KQX74950.1 sugar ABC transporter permease [Aeromicrobium sp. Root472D3]MBD8605220.1 ABC transporter permease [Aeromicrobium sp. CFBP 8757]MCL8251180.1 ABC transporter permease [Aeromicrobium fastidiosum]